jgi:hypothetical protein
VGFFFFWGGRHPSYPRLGFFPTYRVCQRNGTGVDVSSFIPFLPEAGVFVVGTRWKETG